MKNKKFTLSVLTALIAVVAAFVIGCNGKGGPVPKPEFTDAFERTHYAGTVIDVDDYIAAVDGFTATLVIEYEDPTDGATPVNKEGTTVCLAKAGVYNFKYTLSKGKNSETSEKKLTVYDVLPVVMAPASTQLYALNATRPLDVILTRLGPSVISDTDYEMKIVSVKIKNHAPVSLAETVNDNQTDTVDLSEATSFTFDRIADYTFKFAVTNKGGTVYAEFNATVLDNVSADEVDGVDGLKNAQFARLPQGGIDPNTVKLLGNADMANASYVAYDEIYNIGETVRVEFYGKNVPYIGLLTENPEKLDGSKDYGLYAGTGCVFTLERSPKKYSLYATNKFGDGTVRVKISNVNEEIENFGWDHLEAEKHYGLELCLQGVESTWDEERGTYASGKIFWYLYEINADDTYELVAQGAEGKETFGLTNMIKDGRSKGLPKSGQLVFYGSVSKDVTFKVYRDALFGTEFDASGVSFDAAKQIITWDAVEGAERYNVIVNGKLYKQVKKDEKREFSVAALGAEAVGFTTFDIKITPTIGYNGLYSGSYNVSVPVSPSGYEHILLSNGAEIDVDTKTVTLTGRYGTNGYEAFTTGDSTQRQYIAFKDASIVGKYIDFYFTGKNLPQVMMFADNVSLGNMTHSEGGKGILAINGIYNNKGGAEGKAPNRLYVFGPNRIEKTLTEGTNQNRIDAQHTLYESKSNPPKIADSQLVDGQKYKYTVGSVEDGDNIKLVYILSEIGDGETLTEVFRAEVSVAKSSITADMKNIVCYPVIRPETADGGEFGKTVFTFTEPYEIDQQRG